MKQCPVCSRTFSDDTLVYCLDDGSVLANAYDPGATQRMPSPRNTNLPTAPPPQRSKTWLIVLLTSALLLSLVAAGTLISGSRLEVHVATVVRISVLMTSF